MKYVTKTKKLNAPTTTFKKISSGNQLCLEITPQKNRNKTEKSKTSPQNIQCIIVSNPYYLKRRFHSISFWRH